MSCLKHYINCFHHLRRGVTKFGPAPHKLILLLAILDEAESGQLIQNRIEISDRLIDRFLVLWKNYVTTENIATFALPFFHLQHDGFWHLHAYPYKADWLKHQSSINTLGPLRESIQYATLDEELFSLLSDPQSCKILRQTLLQELSSTGYGSIRKECPFCNTISAHDIIVENELAVAFYDLFPVSTGHTLIIPKRHIADYLSLEQEEVVSIQKLSVLCRDILIHKYHPDGFNLGVNVGEAAGQTIFHCHLHLIPRYNGDVLNPRGGVRSVIPTKQSY